MDSLIGATYVVLNAVSTQCGLHLWLSFNQDNIKNEVEADVWLHDLGCSRRLSEVK